MRKRKNWKRSQRKLKQALKNVPSRHSIYRGYLRLDNRYSVDFVLKHIGEWKIRIHGHLVNMFSLRYRTFLKNNASCVSCGIVGKYFRLEKHILHNDPTNNSWHFNLYAVDCNGEEILMTKDHIVPKSTGGANHIDNLQPMCCVCNGKKGSSTGGDTIV